MGELFGAIGQVAGAAISAEAIKEATEAQIAALERQRAFVFEQLDPNRINVQSTAADIQNAFARLALQGEIDPALLRTRYAAEDRIAQELRDLGVDSSRVSGQAISESLAPRENEVAAKNAMIDAALEQLQLGATLPPDVQNELVQAGLEQSGMVTGAASGKGVGGQLLRTILGQAGLKLKQQREQQAAALMDTASNLETKRQNILQSLFPSLAQVQLANLGGATSALSTAEALKPTAGLTGSDVANIWLARVGATNQLTQSAADAAARGSMGVGQAWGNAVGGASGALGRALPLSTVTGWLGFGGRQVPTGSSQLMNYGDFGA